MYARNHRIVLFCIVVVLFACAVLIWTPLVKVAKTHTLTVSFLDVGQGDAVLIETPSGRRALVDGGVGNGVLRELGAVMPLFDRSIDIIVATHPDADHVGGLVEVMQRYDIGVLVRPGASYEKYSAMSAVRTQAARRGVPELIARRGQVIDFADGVRIEILFPDRNVAGFASNDASIVTRVIFGDHAFLLTGDSPQNIEEYLVGLDGAHTQSTVLKVGHHGSRTSSSTIFLGYVHPQYGVLSRGCDNRYGHPHEEVLTALSIFEVTVLDTCTNGRIEFSTDGSVLHVKSSR